MTTQHDERAELPPLPEGKAVVRGPVSAFNDPESGTLVDFDCEGPLSYDPDDGEELFTADQMREYARAALLAADAQAGGEVVALHEKIKYGAQTYGPLLKAAIDLLAAVDARHDQPDPLKYTIPYGAVNALRDAINTHPQPQAVAQGWKDGDTAKLVNDLRDVAVQFRDAEQLRERIAHVIRPLTYRLSASPAAPAAAQVAQPLTEKEIEAGRGEVFSINNPFCPCDSKTFLKAVRWTERKHGIGKDHA